MIKNIFKHIRLFSNEKVEITECSTGTIIERRHFLWLPVMTAAALIAPKSLKAAGTSAFIEGTLTWEDFIKDCLPKAAELHKDSSKAGQDAYLFWIASMAARLNLGTVPKAKLGKYNDVSPAVEFGLSYRGVPFFVVEWQMSPHACFPPHNHPNASVCTVGIEGEARIRNFEIVGEAPEFSSHQKFKVRETHSGVISAGRINALSAQRDNIHTFQVGKDGARGIDISTYHGPDIGFSFLGIEEKNPIDREQKIFAANWIKF
jgi:hypothetical protein